MYVCLQGGINIEIKNIYKFWNCNKIPFNQKASQYTFESTNLYIKNEHNLGKSSLYTTFKASVPQFNNKLNSKKEKKNCKEACDITGPSGCEDIQARLSRKCQSIYEQSHWWHEV